MINKQKLYRNNIISTQVVNLILDHYANILIRLFETISEVYIKL